MFIKTQNTTNIPSITPEQAQDIYGMYKALEIGTHDISQCFERQSELWFDYPFVYFEEVANEMKALMDVAYSAMMRDKSPSSELELQWELASDLLDIPTFVSDYMDFVLVYKENTGWAEFEEQFTFLKSQNDII